MAMEPKIVANITTNERSLNLNKLIAAVTKVAIPAIIAHVPTMTMSGVPGCHPAAFLPRMRAKKNTRKTANNPPAHFPSFVFGIIFPSLIRHSTSNHLIYPLRERTPNVRTSFCLFLSFRRGECESHLHHQLQDIVNDRFLYDLPILHIVYGEPRNTNLFPGGRERSRRHAHGTRVCTA